VATAQQKHGAKHEQTQQTACPKCTQTKLQGID